VHDLSGVQAAVSGSAKMKLMCQIYSLIISGTYTECIKKNWTDMNLLSISQNSY
jgi:hypothetical protein